MSSIPTMQKSSSIQKFQPGGDTGSTKSLGGQLQPLGSGKLFKLQPALEKGQQRLVQNKKDIATIIKSSSFFSKGIKSP